MASTALIRSKVGAHQLRVVLPTGKELVKTFNKDNDFTCEIPTKIVYKDLNGKDRVYIENWAQHILDSYPEFELVSVNEPEPVVQSVIKKKVGRPRKEETNETV